MTTVSVIDQARAYAARVVGSAVSTVAGFSDTMAGLEKLSEIEQRAAGVRNQLQEMVNAGIATARDYQVYDTMRGSLWSAQMTYWNLLVRVFSRIGMADQIPNLPVPQALPPMAAATLRPIAPPAAGVRGLGAPPPPIPPVLLWAAAALALIAALAIVAAVVAVGLSVYEVASVFIAEVQVKQLEVFYTARVRAYHDCLASGHSPAECAAAAGALAPTPQDALPRAPESGISAIAWAVGGLAAVTIGILGITKMSGGRNA